MPTEPVRKAYPWPDRPHSEHERGSEPGSRQPPAELGHPMNTPVNAGLRLDAGPIGRFHRRLAPLVSLGIFFDSFDNTLSAAVLASMLPTGFSTLELNSLFLSVAFAGLAIGAAFAGWLSDRVGRGSSFSSGWRSSGYSPCARRSRHRCRYSSSCGA
jgi:hypothetical protein